MRKDDPNPVLGQFSMADAARAGLKGKSGPWQQYPQRMLQMRARGFALRDAFPDVLRGLISAEVAMDIPFEATGLTPRHDPEPAPVRAEPVPTEPRKPTITEWLDALQTRLDVAQTADAVDEIVASVEVQKALDGLRNGAKDRLNKMLTDAEARTAPPTNGPDDEEMPGIAP